MTHTVKKILLMTGFSTLALCGLYGGKTVAENLSYMDHSGNIHFVDSLADIPQQYIEQIIKPTPPPRNQAEYKKQMAEWKQRQEDAERERRQRLYDRQQQQQNLIKSKANANKSTGQGIDNNGPKLGFQPSAAFTPNALQNYQNYQNMQNYQNIQNNQNNQPKAAAMPTSLPVSQPNLTVPTAAAQ